MKPAGFLFHWFAVIVVSGWMLLAFSWLSVSRKLPGGLLFGLAWRGISSPFRRRYRAGLGDLLPENGHCFLATVPAKLPSDVDLGSTLVLLEDGVALPHPHSGHDDIRTIGQGRYSHWGSAIYFSTSDNSDPRENGRTYTVEEK